MGNYTLFELQPDVFPVRFSQEEEKVRFVGMMDTAQLMLIYYGIPTYQLPSLFQTAYLKGMEQVPDEVITNVNFSGKCGCQ